MGLSAPPAELKELVVEEGDIREEWVVRPRGIPLLPEDVEIFKPVDPPPEVEPKEVARLVLMAFCWAAKVLW